MKKTLLILSCSLLFGAALNGGATAFGQGFGGYVAPAAPTRNGGVPAPAPAATGLAPALNRPISSPAPAFVAQNVPEQNAPAPVEPTGASASGLVPLAPTATPVSAPAAANPVAATNPAPERSDAPQGGVLSDATVQSAIVPPPANYKLTENEQIKLDEFLTHWENFGKGIKRISCDVHMKEFDGGLLQQNAKKPVAHTWGLFRFIAPNKLQYHVKGEFSYSDDGDPVWKEGQNEWEIVLDGKSLTQYDYKNKKAVVYPIVKEEQNIDLTMDNGQFPLFFIAKSDVLKNRFYMRLVTPKSKLQSEVWIEAFPRYARDAQQFRSIVVILGLKDMQPTYMRKNGVNGKSKTDLMFENVSVNKGKWDIEGTVDSGWTKDVREEEFSLLQRQPTETSFAQTAPPSQRAFVPQSNQTPQNARPSQSARLTAANPPADANATPFSVVSPETASRQGVARVASPTPGVENAARRY